MSFRQLNEIFGFKEEERRTKMLTVDECELKSLWETIAVGNFKLGGSTRSLIRHPVLRYAHKALAHTFYARKETEKVSQEELELLDVGLSKLIGFHTRGGTRVRGDRTRIGMVSLFVRQLLSYQDWVPLMKDKDPELSTGRIITPIFEACGHRLGTDGLEPERIDIFYLGRTFFLSGRLGHRFAYKFAVDLKTEDKICLLCLQATSFQELSNIDFVPAYELLYNPAANPPLESIAKRGTFELDPHQISEEEEVEEEEQGCRSPIYDSERYYFSLTLCQIQL